MSPLGLSFLIIPISSPTSYKTTSSLAGQKIVLAQSYNYIVNSLLPGLRYADFKIRNIITTSDAMTNFIKEYHGDIYNIKAFKLGIPDYFKPNKFKKPVISFVCRNTSDILKINKLFYLKYPQFRWIGLKTLEA